MDIIDGLSSISGSEDDEPSDLPKILEKVTIEIQENDPEDPAQSLQSCRSSRKVYFENASNQIIVMYSVVLSENQFKDTSITFDLANFLSIPPKWAVVMISGGHFAAAVFHGNKEILHKTIHRYTVRAKQGGSQARADNKSGGSGGPKSAGSSLRRHNEQALTQEIQTLLKSWEAELNSCQWIFYRAGGHSSGILFSGKTPIFSKKSKQLVSIPFPTKRPTFNELKKVVAQLTTVKVYDRDDFKRLFLSKEKSPGKNKKKKVVNRAKSRSPKRKTQEDILLAEESEENSWKEIDNESEFILVETPTEINLENELQEYGDSLTKEEKQNRRKRTKPKKEIVKIELTGVVGEIVNEIMKNESTSQIQDMIMERLRQEHEKNSKTPEELGVELRQVIDAQNSTLLHLAVKTNSLDLIWCLLDYGSDPCIKDKNGKCPYNLATDKEARNVFRRFRAKFPEKYNYEKAQVPPALTSEMEQEIEEKKKLLNKLKREKEKQKKAERKEKEAELDEQKRFLSLSDSEKRALAAERRLLGQCKRNGENTPILLRCFDCGIDITGKVPFEYNNNKFCSSKCLATHRKKFPVPLSL